MKINDTRKTPPNIPILVNLHGIPAGMIIQFIETTTINSHKFVNNDLALVLDDDQLFCLEWHRSHDFEYEYQVYEGVHFIVLDTELTIK